jgi:hypothetical protein
VCRVQCTRSSHSCWKLTSRWECVLSLLVSSKRACSTQTCVRVLLEAVLFAAQSHVRCLTDQNTTLLCGMLSEVETTTGQHKWVYSGVSVGDTKLYRCSVQMGSVQEITMTDPQKESVRDAGGHLGEHPSFLNLHSICCMLDEGDILLLLSDGVHDNLEPEFLGVSPQYFGRLCRNSGLAALSLPSSPSNRPRECRWAIACVHTSRA